MLGFRLATSVAAAVFCYCIVGLWQRFASSGSEFSSQVRLYASFFALCSSYVALICLARSRAQTMSARRILSLGIRYGSLGFLACSFALATILFAFDSGSCTALGIFECLWSSLAFGVAAPAVLAWRSFGLLPIAAMLVAVTVIVAGRAFDKAVSASAQEHL
jgi:hypothetical protein